MDGLAVFYHGQAALSWHTLAMQLPQSFPQSSASVTPIEHTPITVQWLLGNSPSVVGVETTAPLLLARAAQRLGGVHGPFWLPLWVRMPDLANESQADGHMPQAEPMTISPGTSARTLGKKAACFGSYARKM